MRFIDESLPMRHYHIDKIKFARLLVGPEYFGVPPERKTQKERTNAKTQMTITIAVSILQMLHFSHAFFTSVAVLLPFFIETLTGHRENESIWLYEKAISQIAASFSTWID